MEFEPIQSRDRTQSERERERERERDSDLFLCFVLSFDFRTGIFIWVLLRYTCSFVLILSAVGLDDCFGLGFVDGQDGTGLFQTTGAGILCFEEYGSDF